MRVMLVRPGPHFSVQDVADGWSKALRGILGDTFADFNLDDRLDFYDQHPLLAGADKFVSVMKLTNNSLIADVFKFSPDWVVVVSGFFVHHETLALLRARGVRTCLLATESPYEDE